MKKKLFLSAAILVAVALLIAVRVKTFIPKLSESDLLLNENIEALTQNEETALWIRTDGDCKYETTGKAFSTVTINVASVGIFSVRVDASGHASYIAHDAKTDCMAGGKQQCQARYCPVAFWNQ